MPVRRFVTAVASATVAVAFSAAAASAQLLNTGVGTITGAPSAGTGLGQGVAVSTATTLTQFGFWLGTPTAGTSLKYLIWDGTSNSLAFSQTRTLAAATAANTLQLSNAFSFVMQPGRTYFLGVVADQDFTVSANLIPAAAPSQNGITFDNDGNVVFGGFASPTTSTAVDDRGAASLALQIFGTQATSVVPEPATVALVGAGLAALGAAARRRSQTA